MLLLLLPVIWWYGCDYGDDVFVMLLHSKESQVPACPLPTRATDTTRNATPTQLQGGAVAD